MGSPNHHVQLFLYTRILASTAVEKMIRHLKLSTATQSRELCQWLQKGASKMPRPKKDGVHINYYIEKDVKGMLDAYCEEVGQTNTMAVERTLRSFLENHFSKKGKQKLQ